MELAKRDGIAREVDMAERAMQLEMHRAGQEQRAEEARMAMEAQRIEREKQMDIMRVEQG